MMLSGPKRFASKIHSGLASSLAPTMMLSGPKRFASNYSHSITNLSGRMRRRASFAGTRPLRAGRRSAPRGAPFPAPPVGCRWGVSVHPT